MKLFTLKQVLPFFIILFGVAVFLLLYLSKPSAQAIAIKERAWHVETIKAELQTLSPVLTLYGRIETPALIKATAPHQSRVTEVFLHEGQAITTGQLLLGLDSRDFQPLVKQAAAKVSELQAMIASEAIQHQANQRALKHEQALLKLSAAAVNRAQQLKNKNLGSTAALEEAQETLQRQQLALSNRKMLLIEHDAKQQQLLARIQYAQADLELAQLNLERSQIKAPFDGFIEKLHVAQGDQVNENQLLISFYPQAQLEVRAKIPATYQHELQLELSKNQALLATADIGGQPLQLRLNRFAGMADARGIDALFTITQGNQFAHLGSTLSLSLQRPAIDNVIAVPYSSVYDNNRIYKVVDKRLQSIAVTPVGEHINADHSTRILVSSSALKAHDLIVTTHLPNAINGLRVDTGSL